MGNEWGGARCKGGMKRWGKIVKRVCGIIKIDGSTSIDEGGKHVRESVLELDERR